MIIDPTDFNDREYKVPNQEESRDFISFIEKKEEELAIKYLLGADLWDAFQEGLETSGEIEAHWLALRNGGNYTSGGKTYRYNGWVDTIRPGVFSEWQPLGTYKFTNIGWVENSAPQQSKLIDDQYSFHVTYWNKFAANAGYSADNAYNCNGTFYGFMKANKSDYDDWVFKCPKFKNRHDL